jgi:hypothetical protein
MSNPFPVVASRVPEYNRANTRSGKPNLNYLQNALDDLGISPTRGFGGGSIDPTDLRRTTSSPTASPAETWFRDWQNREFEAEGGSSPIAPYITGTPSGLVDQTVGGLRLAGERFGQTAAGLGAMVGVPGEAERRDQYERRADEVVKYLNRDPNTMPTYMGTPGERLAALVNFAPEVYNPVKAGVGFAGKLVGPLNTAFHAMMGYAPNQSAADAGLSGGSHVAGEAIEDVVTGGRGVPGQPIGAAIEKGLPIAEDFLDWLSQRTQAPSASYIPIRP